MKAPAFDYTRPQSLEEACALLAQHGEQARLLAGGQTLLATLNMRLSEPDILIDLRDVKGMRGISLQPDHVRIGALTTHAQVEDSTLIARHAPLLAQAAPHVAHRAIRNRGTIGGSIAYADPAAEWPACCLATDATLILTHVNGQRRIKARDFFLDLYSTALQAGEILTALEFPIAPPTQRVFFSELVRRHGDYAIAGLAATGNLNEQGGIDSLHLAFLGVSTTPFLAIETAQSLHGVHHTELAEALLGANACLQQELRPLGDVYHTASAKRHLSSVLLERALRSLTTPAGEDAS